MNWHQSARLSSICNPSIPHLMAVNNMSQKPRALKRGAEIQIFQFSVKTLFWAKGAGGGLLVTLVWKIRKFRTDFPQKVRN